MAGIRIESSGKTPARSALVMTTRVLTLKTECGCVASRVARRGGGCSYSKIRIKMVFESKQYMPVICEELSVSSAKPSRLHHHHPHSKSKIIELPQRQCVSANLKPQARISTNYGGRYDRVQQGRKSGDGGDDEGYEKYRESRIINQIRSIRPPLSTFISLGLFYLLCFRRRLESSELEVHQQTIRTFFR